MQKKMRLLSVKKNFLLISKIYLKNVNILSKIDENDDNLFIKVRSSGRLIKAKAKINNEQAEVVLKENESGVAPGQACVFYSKNKFGDKVLGGGWIASTKSNY